jgi:hypothetical protein
MSKKLYLLNWTLDAFLKKLRFLEKHYGPPSFRETKTVLLNSLHGIIYVDKNAMYTNVSKPMETVETEIAGKAEKILVDEKFHYRWILDSSESIPTPCTYIPMSHSTTSITTIAYTLTPDICLTIEYFSEDPTHVIDFYFFLTTPNFIPWQQLYLFFKKMNIHL